MNDITTTIAKLKKQFTQWHNDDYDDLHDKTTNYVNERLAEIISNSETSNLTITNQVVSVAQFLSKTIDGNTNITKISDIFAELSNKDNNWSTGNLKSLDTKTANNTSRIAVLENANYTTKGYVDSLVSSNGMKTITIPSGAKLNNYKNFGFYKSISSSISNSINFGSDTPNGAKTSPFNLIVIDANADDNGDTIKQILLTIGSGSSSNKIFTRNCNAGTWTQWQELYGTHNTTELPMEVTFEDSQTTQTYKILRVVE